VVRAVPRQGHQGWSALSLGSGVISEYWPRRGDCRSVLIAAANLAHLVGYRRP
jgi:hypothetical protein